MKSVFEIKISLFTAFFTSFILVSCTNSDSNKNENTHSKGLLKVYADDTFQPILGTSIETFEAIYPNAKVTINYLAQENSIDALTKGEVDFIVTGRALNKSEVAAIKNRGLYLKINQLASDGIVFIVSKNNARKIISEEEIKAAIIGKDAISLVIDKSNSGNLIYLKEKYKLSNTEIKVSAAGSDSAVIDYVSKHSNAIGIIGMALVSDLEDTKVKSRLAQIDLMTISYKDSLGATKLSLPSLDELALGLYPFKRNVYLVNVDGSGNLGTGFANFLVGEKGQRIILKSGLLPFQLPSREIIINNETF